MHRTSTERSKIAVVAVAVVAAAVGIGVAEATESDEPQLVEVPCDPSEAPGVKCYDPEAIQGASQQQEFTLMCNSFSAAKEEELRAHAEPGTYCGPEIPDIPEDQEEAAGIHPLPDQPVQP
ncbi:MAG: hypothetical protein ACRDL1_00190 [Solirubrobacterales bacterium]